MNKNQNNLNIVAIGGGNKDKAINHAIELTGEERPSVLLLPSASSTQTSYNKKVGILTDYFNNLGLETETLHDFNESPSETRIQHELGRASLLYTIGGNSPYMLRTMHEHGTDIAVAAAIRGGKVHAGTSAGALLPFEIAHSNVSAKPSLEEWDYEYLDTLGIIPGVATAHADQHDPTPYGQRPDSRRDALQRTFPTAAKIGYAIDNNAALVLSGGKKYVVRSNDGAEVHVLRNDNDSVSSESLE